MAKKVPHAVRESTDSLPSASSTDADAPSPAVDAILAQIEETLAGGNYKHALELVSRSKIKSPWLTNAAGVCQLRQGNTTAALHAFRSLVVASGMMIRQDVPDVFKANFATALFASGNIDGGDSAVSELKSSTHPAAEAVCSAYANWKGRMSLWQKILWHTTGSVPGPVEFDSPLGALR
jgi:hypothetical protein